MAANRISVSFILQHPTRKSSVILLCLTYNGKRVRVSTGQSVPTISWDKDKQKVKASASGSLEINQKLNELKARAEEVFLTAKNVLNIIPTPDYLKEKLFGVTQTAKEAEVSMLDFFEQFLTAGEASKKEGTIKTYRTTQRYLKGFAEKNGITLSFDKMDVMFYDSFLSYLTKTLKLNNNTAGKAIKIVKTFLRYATECGMNTKTNFTKFKVITEESLNVALSQEELERIEKLELSPRTALPKVRDLFLLQCYTGLRYSDMAKLKDENIREKYINIFMVKTKEPLRVPLMPKAKAILDKYQNNLPVISSQRMNEHLKDLGKLAEIDESIQLITYRGTKRHEEVIPKYKLISTHTGRRTFVTLSLEKGMRPETVMRITGHKDLKSFKKYIKITEKVTEEELLQAWG